jgi:hypothetical protein
MKPNNSLEFKSMGKEILVTILLFFSAAAVASENIVVLANDGSNDIALRNVQQQYIYGKVIAHLESCNIGNPPNSQLASKENIEKLKGAKHIVLLFPKGAIKILIGAELSEVSEVYVTFTSENSPAGIVTKQGNMLQHYSKCSGHSALYSFTCDTVISKLMSVGSKSICDQILAEYQK